MKLICGVVQIHRIQAIIACMLNLKANFGSQIWCILLLIGFHFILFQFYFFLLPQAYSCIHDFAFYCLISFLFRLLVPICRLQIQWKREQVSRMCTQINQMEKKRSTSMHTVHRYTSMH